MKRVARVIESEGLLMYPLNQNDINPAINNINPGSPMVFTALELAVAPALQAAPDADCTADPAP